MVPGQMTGGSSEVIYILDETNRMLTARVYDQNNKRLQRHAADPARPRLPAAAVAAAETDRATGPCGPGRATKRHPNGAHVRARVVR